MMRAVVKVRPEPGALEIVDVPVPTPQQGEVRIRVKYASICGTDVHIYSWDAWAASRIKTPLVIGHEFAGEVELLGPGVEGIEVGDFVSAEGHMACWSCHVCQEGNAHICPKGAILGVDRQGCLAEYVVVPAKNVQPCDPSIPRHICSIQDPLGNAVHTACAYDVKGKVVVVMGVGPIGAMAIAVLRRYGAKTIIAVERNNAMRAAMAKDMGADAVVDYESVSVDQFIQRFGYVDVVLEMSGSPAAVHSAIKVLSPGGKIALLGLYHKPVTLDLTDDVVFKYVTIKGITGRLMFDTWDRMRRLFKDKTFAADISRVVTHRMPFTDVVEAMDLMKKGECGKIVLEF
ncbi:MAG: L-threonine 3-dehydrogenase [Nanoarchaeota archaeon]